MTAETSKLIVLRGLAGSGESTTAELLLRNAKNMSHWAGLTLNGQGLNSGSRI